MIKELFQRKRKLYFVIEKEWVIEDDANEITSRLRDEYKMDTQVVTSFDNIRSSILHFGARHLYLPTNYKFVHPSNKVVFTWYHSSDEDTEFIQSLPEGSAAADFIHTSNDIALNKLVKWGVDRNKIVKIPIGVSLERFRPSSEEDRISLRKELGIPLDAFVIGSFQKDGNGWEEGNEPKLIKGPDIFCDAVELIHKQYPIYVFLTGPARGYVKNRLESSGIPYKHVFSKNPAEVSKYYNLLDLYLVTSRIEGGPKAIMESMASGVPLISSKVGMAPEIIKDGINGFLTEIGDTNSVVNRSLDVINNINLKNTLIKNGLEDVKPLGWDVVIKDYYNKIYSKLI